MTRANVLYRLAARANKILMSLMLSIGAVIAIYPVFYTLISSFKTRRQFADDRFNIPLQPTFQNYEEAFSRLHLDRLLFNSFVATAGGVLLVTIASIMVAYAVTKLRFPGRNIVFLLIIGTLMIPNQTVMYPLYQTVYSMGLIGTHLGLILAFGAFGLPLGTYLVSAYFKSIPNELIEAAVVDGANHWQILTRVMLPIAMPAVVSVGILNAVWMWNDLLLPLLIVAGKDSMTLIVAVSLFRGQYDVHVPLISAGLIISMLPIITVYLLAQTQLIKGLTAGAVK
jgi:raffinose/stachyose/melibiose transport system permease protein